MGTIEAIQSIGGLAGIASVLAVIPQLVAIRKDTAKTRKEVTPNHGSSLNDAVRELKRDNEEWRKVLGHQIGEIRADMSNLRKDVAVLQTKEILS